MKMVTIGDLFKFPMLLYDTFLYGGILLTIADVYFHRNDYLWCNQKERKEILQSMVHYFDRRSTYARSYRTFHDIWAWGEHGLSCIFYTGIG